MKRESLRDRYRHAKDIGYVNGYGIGGNKLSDYSDDQHDQYVSDCIETEQEYFRQFSPFEFTANEFNRSVHFFDVDGNIVKEKDMPWINDKIWEYYDASVYAGILDAWK